MWALDKVETDLLIIFHLTIKRGGTAISIKLVKNKNIHAEEKAVSHVHKYPYLLQAVFYLIFVITGDHTSLFILMTPSFLLTK